MGPFRANPAPSSAVGAAAVLVPCHAVVPPDDSVPGEALGGHAKEVLAGRTDP
jgi:hypothetical protein